MRPSNIPLWLPLGEARVKVTAIGYEPVSQTVSVEVSSAGNPQKLLVQILKPSATAGKK